jgi:hypothetical protein
MNDLVLQVYQSTPSFRVLTTANQNGLGVAETIGAQLLESAGDYLIRVIGRQDMNQFYRLDLALSETPLAGTSADLNIDGETTVVDWELFVANSFTDLSGVTGRDAFARGDLDLDGDNDLVDFRLFKSAYIDANGAGAFASLTGVPEPCAATLMGLAVIGVWAVGRRADLAA